MPGSGRSPDTSPKRRLGSHTMRSAIHASANDAGTALIDSPSAHRCSLGKSARALTTGPGSRSMSGFWTASDAAGTVTMWPLEWTFGRLQTLLRGSLTPWRDSAQSSAPEHQRKQPYPPNGERGNLGCGNRDSILGDGQDVLCRSEVAGDPVAKLTA
jgi:hypothetical protein